ncbi:hypothetical protein [Shewanella sp. 8A]|uniref:hypothetical protein n=1 Tax=Shewanella sp. 8A TaxID=2943323 RepID=UPI00201A6F45|nr:hypothetical protein [Shewanella sp. 8A]
MRISVDTVKKLTWRSDRSSLGTRPSSPAFPWRGQERSSASSEKSGRHPPRPRSRQNLCSTMEPEESAIWSAPARRTPAFVVLMAVDWFDEAETVGESRYPMSDH